MVGRLSCAEFVVFEESGHMFFVEEQDRFVTVLGDFLARHV